MENQLNQEMTQDNQMSMNRQDHFEEKNKKLKINAFIILIFLIYMFASAFVSSALDNRRLEETQDWLDGDINYAIAETEDGYDINLIGELTNLTDDDIDLVNFRFDLLDTDGEILETVYHSVEDLDGGETLAIDVIYPVSNDPVEIEIFTQIPSDPTLGNVLTVILAAIALLALWLVNKDNYIENFKTTKKSVKSFFGTVGVGIVVVYSANIMAQTLMQLFTTPEVSLNEAAIQSSFSSNALNLISLFLALVILVPIIEETVFRKGLYGLVEHRFGDITAIIASGFIFGVLHVAGWGDYINVLPYLAMGLSFSFIYYYSGKNIYVVIAVHAINNLIPFTTYLIDIIS